MWDGFAPSCRDSGRSDVNVVGVDEVLVQEEVLAVVKAVDDLKIEAEWRAQPGTRSHGEGGAFVVACAGPGVKRFRRTNAGVRRCMLHPEGG